MKAFLFAALLLLSCAAPKPLWQRALDAGWIRMKLISVTETTHTYQDINGRLYTAPAHKMPKNSVVNECYIVNPEVIWVKRY